MNTDNENSMDVEGDAEAGATAQEAQEAVESERQRAAAAQQAAAEADERELERLMHVPRTVVAFRKPAALEGLPKKLPLRNTDTEYRM